MEAPAAVKLHLVVEAAGRGSTPRSLRPDAMQCVPRPASDPRRRQRKVFNVSPTNSDSSELNSILSSSKPIRHFASRNGAVKRPGAAIPVGLPRVCEEDH
jgi:hypothetical protein